MKLLLPSLSFSLFLPGLPSSCASLAVSRPPKSLSSPSPASLALAASLVLSSPHASLVFSEPAVFLTADNVPVVWYLPGFIPKHISQPSKRACKHLKEALEESMGGNDCWRTDSTNLHEKYKRSKLPYGTATFSYGWFGQGQAVGVFPLFFRPWFILGTATSKSKARPRPSTSVRDHSVGAALWLQESVVLQRCLNLVLALLHRESYEAGTRVLSKLRTTKRRVDQQ
ncbi:hypothetical protein HGRIS_001528 [Hohenbuehelia grisea]|uniref:Transmembrane protein n=1 Tax=Hohenbuehelia grisea TaxID=104357 RepID=A0ABR3JQM4_9AGAR